MKTFHLLLLLTVLSAVVKPAQASSYLGGGLFYQIDPQGQCTFTFQYLRDCNGCELATCPIPQLQLVTNGYQESLSWKLESTRDVSPGGECLPCNRCTDSNCTMPYGNQLYTYEASVDLSAEVTKNNCHFTASLVVPDMSGLIDNISSGKVYHELEFNACEANNSPRVENHGFYTCVGQDLFQALYRQDQEADSLYYAFAPLLKGPNAENSYQSGFSAQQPVQYLGFPKNFNQADYPYGLHLDAMRGHLLFRPMAKQHGMCRVKSEEHRKGQWLSTSTQDFYLGLIKCPENRLPVISGINCSKPIPANFKTEACAGERICFTICTSDRNGNDSTTIAWDGGILGATFQIIDSNAKNQIARFCWKPTAQDAAQTSPYFRFVVSSHDDKCAVPGVSARVFTIKVNKKAEASYKAESEECGEIRLEAQNTGEMGISQFLWKVDGKLFPRKGGETDTLYYKTAQSGWIPYELILIGTNGCNTSYRDSIKLNPVVLLKDDTTLVGCVNEKLEVDLSKWLVGSPNFFWIDNNSRNPQRSWQLAKDTFYTFYVPGDQCLDTGRVFLDYQQIQADFTLNPGVGDVPLLVKAQNQSERDAYHVKWTFYEGNNLYSSTGNRAQHRYTTTGQHNVKLATASRDSLCLDSITKVGIVNAFPTSIEALAERGVVVYPNPASEWLFIENQGNTAVFAQLVSQDGKLLLSKTIDPGRQTWNVASIAKGNHLLMLQIEGRLHSTPVRIE